MIPISTVRLDSEVEAKVLGVLRSGTLAQGPVVAEFETAFAELVGVRHAVAVNNGTTALVAALHMLDLEPGDEIITTPFTFIATLNAILEAGATARFADIRADDFTLDPASVGEAITPRTRAIMPVHLYGQAADMPAFAAIAEERGLALIEDAAQAHGATVGGRAAGSYGIGCFSFYATKNLTTGEGGIITTDDDDVADRLRVLRNQGMRRRYEYVMAGHNYRMTDLQAAVVIPQLRAYADQVARRRHNATVLADLLAGIPGLVVPRAREGRGHVWHQFTVLLPSDKDREQIVERLADLGVGSGVYYPRLVFDYDAYRDRDDVLASSTPVAREISARCLSLPVHPAVTDADLRTIADSVRRVLA